MMYSFMCMLQVYSPFPVHTLLLDVGGHLDLSLPTGSVPSSGGERLPPTQSHEPILDSLCGGNVGSSLGFPHLLNHHRVFAQTFPSNSGSGWSGHGSMLSNPQ